MRSALALSLVLLILALSDFAEGQLRRRQQQQQQQGRRRVIRVKKGRRRPGNDGPFDAAVGPAGPAGPVAGPQTGGVVSDVCPEVGIQVSSVLLIPPVS